MNSTLFRRTYFLARVLITVCILCGLVFQPAAAQAGKLTSSAHFDIVGPAGSGAFGQTVYALPNGNIVIIDPEFDSGTAADVGAVYLYNGQTKALISTLTGSQAGDRIGYFGITIMKNGDFVVLSGYWANGSALKAGATTWCSGTAGCSGVVSPSNSLVGSSANDQVGSYYAAEELYNGNYVVRSYYWDNGSAVDAGALTFCSGDGGCHGVISSQNSLVGTGTNDRVGQAYTVLNNGNYVAQTYLWNESRGAATWCSKDHGCTGTISSSNSLVGSTPGDRVGGTMNRLQNGNYYLYSPNYDDGPGLVDSGAVTFCNGSNGGCTGVITASNSLLGSTAGDKVGSFVYPQPKGYLVYSPDWDNITDTGTVTNAGAVTWCEDTYGCTGHVSAANSLVGSSDNDRVGEKPAWIMLPGNKYIVLAPSWDNGALADVGAVTYCDGSAGGCVGTISEQNSLIGASPNDGKGLDISSDYETGDYMVMFPNWDSGVIADAGLVHWCSASGGCMGTVASYNSLTGSATGDQVGIYGSYIDSGVFILASYNWSGGTANGLGAVTLCTLSSCAGQQVSEMNSLVGTQSGDHVGNGSYSSDTYNGTMYFIFTHRYWHKQAGAVTPCSGSEGLVPAGCNGPISAENSLVGTADGDKVGDGFITFGDGSYAVVSPNWSNGTTLTVGAITWCPPGGCKGTITPANSLVGTHAGDQIGSSSTSTLYLDKDYTLTGSYIVMSPYWDNGALADAGAVTFCKAGGCKGPVSETNSLVGSTAGENLGEWYPDVLENNSYVVTSRMYESAGQEVGAVAWCAGTSGCIGTIPNQRSVICAHYREFYTLSETYDPVYNRLIVGRPADNMVTLLENYRTHLPILRR